MKKQSLRKYSSSRNTFLSPAVFGAGIVALLILVLAIVRFAAPGAFIAIASPFWRAGTSLTAAVGTGAEGLTSTATLARERDALTLQNTELTTENRTLTARAEDLQKLLGNRTEASGSILASVLARPPVAPYDVLIVDQGTNSNVALGATAYGPGGTPIGTVAAITNTTARITLYSNPGLQTNAWAGDNRIPIPLIGAGSGGFTATIPKSAGTTVGEGIYVAGIGAIPIGVVARVNNDPSSPNVVLQIHPYVNPFSLTWITISATGS